MKCPACFSENLTVKYKDLLYDDRYAYPGRFSLLVCGQCGHGRLDREFSGHEITNLYTGYYPRSSYSISDYKPVCIASGLDALFDASGSFAYKYVPERVRVLDIGCGYCETLGYHESRGCDAYGCEADANVRMVAEKYGFKVHIGVFDHSAYEAGFFDYITMDQLIEHIGNPAEILMGASRILKKGGRLIISTPNMNGFFARLLKARWLHWHVPYHMNFFTKESMTALAERAVLKLVSWRTITDPSWLTHQQIHFTARPIEGEASIFWSPAAKRGLLDKIKHKLFPYAFHKFYINHLLTKMLDTAGIGDNQLFIFEKQ